MHEEAALEADDTGPGPSVFETSPVILSNPLEEFEEGTVAQNLGDEFSFYTDPLAGFSGLKRRRAGLQGLPLSPAPNETPHTQARITNCSSYMQRPSLHPPPSSLSWQPNQYHPLVNPAHLHQSLQFQPQILPPIHTNQSSTQPLKNKFEPKIRTRMRTRIHYRPSWVTWQQLWWSRRQLLGGRMCSREYLERREKK
jgi:hypothetical protein